MASLVNVQEYHSLCSMSFKDIAAMTSQLTALDGSDNFNYIMALQDICSKLSSNKKSNKFSRSRPFSRRKIMKKTTVIKEHSYWWDLLGLFTHETEENIEKSDDENDNPSFISYLLDPLGLFRADESKQVEEKVDKSSSEFYDYYDYPDMNRRLGLDSSETLPYLQSLVQDYYYDYQDQTPSASETSSENNKRLAFVHYVYPRTNNEENAQHFQTFQD